MTVGFVVLAHDAPAATARLVRHLVDQGSPVVVHLDRRADCGAALAQALGGAAPVISTQASEWGMFGLARATMDAARRLLEDAPEVTHVALLSGACMPLRPVAELQGFLAKAGEVDFIEAAPPEEWITGGLGDERFTLYHPVSWRKRRKMFDRLVEWQRRLGIRRALPPGIRPRLGRQWWCLRASTLRLILDHPDLPKWERFFRWVWIPDESCFQTLVASLLPDGARDARGLTLTRFDPMGNPLVFHDDHRGLLDEADHFFVRKIDLGATRLLDWAYAKPGKGHDRFDGSPPAGLPQPDAPPELAGLQMAARSPHGTGVMRPDTACPYLVLVGGDMALLSAMGAHLAAAFPGWVVHGRLFGPGPAEFAGGGETYTGNLSASPVQRDYRPEQYLQHMLWSDRARVTTFLLHDDDNRRVREMVVADDNARIVMVGGTALAPRERAALEEVCSMKIDQRHLRHEIETGGRGLAGQIATLFGEG
ncbi:glycosyl transferase [Rhodobacteraceae bacterium NNCM2]|nr:glycosyl transferase [Coraliihabitans acroporae]